MEGGYIDKLTKAQLLFWVKTNFNPYISRIEYVSLRWKIESDKIEKRRAANSKKLDAFDGKKLDKLMLKYKESKNPLKDVHLLNSITKLNQPMIEYRKEDDKIQVKYKQVEKLFNEMMEYGDEDISL